MSELIGPGVSGECTERCGLHINEDHFLVEVVDPETLEPVDEGEDGELIVTPLSKEAFPLLRYRTRDISNVIYEPCKCGRTFARMEKIKGRSDDMLKIRGVNVFPSQIESVLVGMKMSVRIISLSSEEKALRILLKFRLSFPIILFLKVSV